MIGHQNDNSGKPFEGLVWEILLNLQESNPHTVEVKYQPRLQLQNGETAVPDFELIYRLPFQTDYRLIECQDRRRTSQDIVRKIRHIKSLSPRNRFVFVYHQKAALPESVRQALNADGIPHYDIGEFVEFLDQLDKSLNKLEELMITSPYRTSFTSDDWRRKILYWESEAESWHKGDSAMLAG